ncbi:PWI domain-containing protein [Zalerion maritima]|uniref:PWI domain-containing protein n=1 Tax=Zalerion maritima TaxID=339359 RepID=A0AAD5RUV7_9PEZI|nr:PWI domain-containing protein [Zalerion maritima]
MATGVDAKLLKSTKFPPEFNAKVDMQKVNLQVMKKLGAFPSPVLSYRAKITNSHSSRWIAGRIAEILGDDDDVVIELCFGLIEGSRYPDIKSLQIQLAGFLEKETASFCKELWKLCLSAQTSPQGVPKELLEAKKMELIQEKIEADKAAEEARKRREEMERREREISHGAIETLKGEGLDEATIDLDHQRFAAVAVVATGAATETLTCPAEIDTALLEGEHLGGVLLLLLAPVLSHGGHLPQGTPLHRGFRVPAEVEGTLHLLLHDELVPVPEERENGLAGAVADELEEQVGNEKTTILGFTLSVKLQIEIRFAISLAALAVAVVVRFLQPPTSRPGIKGAVCLPDPDQNLQAAVDPLRKVPLDAMCEGGNALQANFWPCPLRESADLGEFQPD